MPPSSWVRCSSAATVSADGKAVCSRIGLRDLLQQIFPAADQPHGISLRRKALRKAAADAGSGTDDNSSFHMRKDRTRKTENT